MTATDDGFYERLSPFTRFEGVLGPQNYHPVPDDWWVGVADIVDSTGAIAAGRYKAVNFAGAAVIAAVMNTLKQRPFPFVFGGDGAGFAVAEADRPTVAEAMAATRRWASEELELEMRTALVPVRDINAAGLSLDVARYAPAPGVSYAMFAGGGMAWAERQMKAGRYAVVEAPAGARPDLEGLSCRYAPIPAAHGEVLSLIVLPRAGQEQAYTALTQEILRLLARERDEGRPVPENGPPIALSTTALGYEALAAREGSRTLAFLRALIRGTIAFVVIKTGMKVKTFEPAHYRRQTAINTDFRKFDDGLKLTVDCDAATAAALEAALQKAQAAGVCHYGLHRQAEALMTCLVPSVFRDDHMHFVDGAAGGYAQAAMNLKRQIA